MAWKQVTQSGTNYFVNLDEVAYLQDVIDGTVIVFSAISDQRRVMLTVEQKPHQILNGENVTL